MEDWFSGLERALDSTIIEIMSGGTGLYSLTSQDLNKFVMGFIGLKHRTRFELEKISEYVTLNKANEQLVDGTKSIVINVLENLINTITQESARYFQFDMMVLTADRGSFVIGDRPFIENLIDGYSFIPISPKKLLGIRPSKNHPYCHFKGINDGLVKSFNSLMASQAKYWLVGDSEELIKSHIGDIRESIEGDDVEFVPSLPMFAGYYFK